MSNVIVRKENVLLRQSEINWIKQINGSFRYSNPSLTMFTSMIFGFAKNLPYSMDIEQLEYVPADFLNYEPLDVEQNNWFKWDDRRTYFNALVHWGDTFKTGILLQVCNVFQQMILGNFPSSYELDDNKYYEWKIDRLTTNEEYNKKFFEILKYLPIYYEKLVSSSSVLDRRKVLDEMYLDVMDKISQRYGGFVEKDSNGNVIKETKGTIQIRPYRDIEMFVYWDNIEFFDGIPNIIKLFKDEQLKIYNERKNKKILILNK